MAVQKNHCKSDRDPEILVNYGRLVQHVVFLPKQKGPRGGWATSWTVYLSKGNSSAFLGEHFAANVVHPSRFRRFYTILLQSLLLPRSLTEMKAHQNQHPRILNHQVVVLPTHLRDALCHCPGTWKYARYQPHDTHKHNTWGCTGYVGCGFFAGCSMMEP